MAKQLIPFNLTIRLNSGLRRDPLFNHKGHKGFHRERRARVVYYRITLRMNLCATLCNFAQCSLWLIANYTSSIIWILHRSYGDGMPVTFLKPSLW